MGKTLDELLAELSAGEQSRLLLRAGELAAGIVVPMCLLAGAQRPTQERATDAGWDLYTTQTMVLRPGDTVIAPTGLIMAIPWGYYGCIKERSGYGSKGLGVGAGVIDPGYREEVGVVLRHENLSAGPITITPAKAIAQIIFRLGVRVTVEEVRREMLPGGDRPGGFGTSDAAMVKRAR